MIEAFNLSRRYGDFTAVDGVSFSIQEGEIVGILGPNGAGKTTTIRMITGFLPPTAGRITVGGKDLFAEPGAARRDLGYLPENVALYPEMRVSEYLAYRAQLEGMSRADAKAAIPRTLERCLLADVSHQIVGTLSKGYRQRVGLAAAILHNPKVLVLDEPTVGLDPKQIIAIRELIRELGRSHTLLLSTHILPEVELLCGRVLIIDRGKVIAEGSPQELRERWRGNVRLRVELDGQPAEASEALAALPGVETVRADGQRLVVEHDAAHDLRAEVFRLAVAKGWTLLELAEARASLEDIFVRLTTRETVTEGDEPEAPAVADASEEVVS